MDPTRLLTGAAGVLVLGLVAWAMKAGRYPSHTEWVTRDDRPIAFWSALGLSLCVGAALVLSALLTK